MFLHATLGSARWPGPGPGPGFGPTDTNISEEKHYFSSGQRQLFCLARAILRGSVCLVLDEATSSLDTDTEQLVLRAAKKAFKGRTVITIAVSRSQHSSKPKRRDFNCN